ncbi:hypothetical protein ACFE04_006470 [Oxalis oulophora]
MVSIRFSCLILALLFAMQVLMNSHVHAHRGSETIGDDATGTKKKVSYVEKEIFGGGSDEKLEMIMIKGRKMMSKEKLEKSSINNDNNSGAKQFEAGFLTTDYHGPKHHPPKHN